MTGLSCEGNALRVDSHLFAPILESVILNDLSFMERSEESYTRSQH